MVIKVIIRDYFTNLLPYLIAINTLYVFFGKVSPMFREFLSEVPVPTAGLALGIVALGKLIGSTLPAFEIACASISALLIALVTLKALVCRKQLAAAFIEYCQRITACCTNCMVCRSMWSVCFNDLVHQRTNFGI